jgi:oligoribonuclease
MKHNENFFIWIDLETTGLIPDYDVPLEVAMVITDSPRQPIVQADELDRVLNVVGIYRSTIYATLEELGRMNDWCKKQHTKSDLLLDVSAYGQDLEIVDAQMADLIRKCGAAKATLAGNSVHFDRGFLKEHFPKTFELLHYRNLDTSTLERMLHDVDIKPPFEKPTGHRAPEDIEYSMDVYRFAHRVMSTAAGEGFR